MSRYDEFEPGEDFPLLEDIATPKQLDRAKSVFWRILRRGVSLGEARNGAEDGATIPSPRATRYPRWMSGVIGKFKPKVVR